MPLQPGTTLGPYQIDAPLGAGGMGEVYQATDTRLDRIVAIKVLPAHVAADPDLKQRLEREAKTVAALSHPHICPVFDVGNQDGIDFLVMDYLDGQTLAQRLEKGALPLDQTLQIAFQGVTVAREAISRQNRPMFTRVELGRFDESGTVSASAKAGLLSAIYSALPLVASHGRMTP